MLAKILFSKLGKFPPILGKPFTWGLQTLLLITVICVFVPFSPMMPGEGLDPSWVFGMNQAIAQGMVFGRDTVFTFGPYASIYTKTYHPATDHLMMLGSLYLGLSYGIAVFLLSQKFKWHQIAALLLVLSGLMYHRDALLFSYPLLVGLFCYQLINQNESLESQNKIALYLTIILFLPFGLLPLIKGSVLILCGAVAALSALLFSLQKRWTHAIAIVVAPLSSLIIFWVMSGQSIWHLPLYFFSMIPIVSGYTEAMSLKGNGGEVGLYIAAASVLLAAIIREEHVKLKPKIFILLVFFVYIFLAFKGGFVRHDGHAVLASTSLLIAAMYFAFTFQSRYVLAVLFISISTWIYIDSRHIKTSTQSLVYKIKSTYSVAWSGAKNRIFNSSSLKTSYENTLAYLHNKSKFPSFVGTTDIYSFNQSYLIASNNIWNPRPILQSYSVYTHSLAQKNKQHLIGKDAPDNVIFKVEPIDGRIPSIEDGSSWPEFLSRYKPTALENEFLYLEKVSEKVEILEDRFLAEGSYSLGDTVAVPIDSEPIFAEILIEQSFLGKLANFLYKPSELQILINLENGTTKNFRIISGMAKAGLLISPLVESTTEFGLLYGAKGYLLHKQVKSFSIIPFGEKRHWKKKYEVKFRKLASHNQIDASKLIKFNASFQLPREHKVVVAESCDGSIDSINGAMPSLDEFTASGVLDVHGWLAKSVDHGTVPESVLLVLSDGHGKNVFFNTRQTLRPDVGTHFNRATLTSVGYASFIDVSLINGRYTLGLAFTEGNTIKLCPQFKIPAKFIGVASRE